MAAKFILLLQNHTRKVVAVKDTSLQSTAKNRFAATHVHFVAVEKKYYKSRIKLLPRRENTPLTEAKSDKIVAVPTCFERFSLSLSLSLSLWWTINLASSVSEISLRRSDSELSDKNVD